MLLHDHTVLCGGISNVIASDPSPIACKVGPTSFGFDVGHVGPTTTDVSCYLGSCFNAE